MTETTDRLVESLRDLMGQPGLSGHEGRVRRAIAARLAQFRLVTHTDRLGNLTATIKGDPSAPSVMVFTHMDQLGFLVRAIEADGYIRLERLGGVPERALASQQVLLCIGEGRDRPAIIANRAHHATTPDEKFKVVGYRDVFVDAGFETRQEALDAGVTVGTPVVYAPSLVSLGPHRVAGAAIDDRAGCAVLLEVAAALAARPPRATVHFVFSVQEEFNLRGAQVAAQRLNVDIAVQVDLMLAADTPDMRGFGEIAMGAGATVGLYSFHGRGTLNGTLPHPALVKLFEDAAATTGRPLQRSAHTGVLTDSSYVQLVGEGVAAIDVGFPIRYSHSSREVCDLRDLEHLVRVLVAGVGQIGPDTDLDRDSYD